MKKCTKCNDIKSYENFYKHSRYLDGYGSYCKDCYSKYQKHYKVLNRNKIRERKKNWAKNNPEKVKRYDKKYLENNRAKINTYNAKRRSEKLFASVNISNDKHLINELYQDANDCQWLSELKLEVDHIIPLKHEKVCGLHVSWNLQLLTREDNAIKKNKFDGTYDNESWRIK